MQSRKSLSARDIEELHESLASRLGDTSVPTLPQVAVRVIELVSDPNSSVNQFAEVIKTDQALTGRLLRVANSAAFAQRGQVTKLERAMVLLGMDRLKAMALGFHLSQAAGKDADDDARKLWAQSLFRGWVALRIAEKIHREVAGEAFIVGLMLDSGVPMMPKLAGPSYKQFVNKGDAPQKQFATEMANLPFTHVDIAAALGRIWKLPESLTRPIWMHHSLPDKGPAQDPLGILHRIAFFVGSLKLGGDGMPGETAPRAATANQYFGLKLNDVEALFRQAAEDFSGSQELFANILPEAMSVEAILDRANEHLNEAVEDLIEDTQAADATLPVRRFEAGDLILEMEPGSNESVTVFITDAEGNRLASEQVNPLKQSTRELRTVLLLEDLDEGQMTKLVETMTQLAA